METVKIDVMQIVTDARGREYPLQEGDEPLRVRDLIHMAMGDEMPPQPGMQPPTVSADDKRRRWRLSTQAMACNGELEVSRSDADYLTERAAVMLYTPTFGFLDMVLTQAIGQSVPSPETAPSDTDNDA